MPVRCPRWLCMSGSPAALRGQCRRCCDRTGAFAAGHRCPKAPCQRPHREVSTRLAATRWCRVQHAWVVPQQWLSYSAHPHRVQAMARARVDTAQCARHSLSTSTKEGQATHRREAAVMDPEDKLCSLSSRLELVAEANDSVAPLPTIPAPGSGTGSVDGIFRSSDAVLPPTGCPADFSALCCWSRPSKCRFMLSR